MIEGSEYFVERNVADFCEPLTLSVKPHRDLFDYDIQKDVVTVLISFGLFVPIRPAIVDQQSHHIILHNLLQMRVINRNILEQIHNPSSLTIFNGVDELLAVRLHNC